MSDSFDVIIIGSGFGGAVTACRLAERGMSVLILERGRRWEVKDYPRGPGDAWFYDADKPQTYNGWLDFYFLGQMTVVTGAGVGGGSLVYANVSAVPPKRTFEQGWPPEITYEELLPYYDVVGHMLNVQTIPLNQVPTKYGLVREGADALGYGDRFKRLELAVTFDPDWNPNAKDPFGDEHSKKFINAFGKEQGTCVHSGNCDVGCQVKAKNTLDVNYLAVAEQKGAEIRPLHLARYVKPEDGGYRVYYDRIANGRLIPGSEKGARVILAAGSLGSTEILLRSRDQYKTLPNVSPFLGHNWSSNGDFLNPAIYAHRQISAEQGPTITCSIDFLNEPFDGKRFTIEDGGFPDFLGNWAQQILASDEKKVRNKKIKLLLEEMGVYFRNEDPFSRIMPWFSNGVDAANGRLYLKRPWYCPWTRKLRLDWQIEKSKALFEAIIKMHTMLSDATGGKIEVSPLWKYFNLLITPHPLGGCNMGSTPADGVVNHKGEVFGYPNLYVADGAIVPEAIGINPSRTIAALSERIAKLMES